MARGSAKTPKQPRILSKASESTYRTLFDAMTEGFALVEPLYDDQGTPVSYRYLEVNAAFERMTRKTRVELLGKTIQEVFPTVSQHAIEVMARVARSGAPEHFEDFSPPMDTWAACYAYCPEPGRVAFLVTDVTERRSVDDALRAERARLTAILQNIPEEIWFADKTKRVTQVNQAVMRGFEPGLGIGKQINEIAAGLEVYRADGTLRPPEESPLLRALHGELVKDEEEDLRLPTTGELRHRLVSASPVVDPKGIAIGSISVVRDITERKQAEQALERSNQRNKEILASIKDDFYVLDRNWIFVYANRQFTSRIGKEPQNLIGNCIWTMFPKHLGTDFEANLRTAMEKREIRRFEVSGKYTDAVYRMAVFPSAEGVTVLGTEVTEQKRAERLLASDLAALTRMHELSGKLTTARGIQPLLQEIMEAAVAIVAAERGTLQLFREGDLRIVAHHGHKQPFLDFFSAAESVASACGEATKQGERVVVCDVEESALFRGTPSLAVLREAGVRAIQSTPIVSRSGRLLGILTTHWGLPHAPSEHDLWRIDLLVRQAADLIEIATTEEAAHSVALFPEEDPYPVLRIDGTGKLLYANRASSDILAHFQAKTGQAAPGPFRQAASKALQGRTMQTFDFTHGLAVYSFVTVPFEGRGYVNLYGRDVTEQRHAEASLRRITEDLEARVEERTAELARAYHELESFSYTVGHDLKAPLRAIKGFSGLILRKGQSRLTAEEREHLTFIEEGAQRMERIISALLEFSRLTAKEMRRSVVETRPLVEEVVREQRRLLGKAEGSHVTVEVGDLPAVKADPLLLRQVFANLLSNAFKYTRMVAQPCVRITSEVRGGLITFCVEDNGVGFPREQAERLFNVFQRLHAEKDFEGTGIGLAAVRKIIERHGGHVCAEGEEGRGARFYVTLPREG